MEAFESGVLDLPDFYFTGDDYRYRFDPEAKERFLGLLRERFNSRVTYMRHALKWDTVIEQKAVGLNRYLVGRSARLDFREPEPILTEIDDRELCKHMLDLSEAEARLSGIKRSTYYHLRRKNRTVRFLRTYNKTKMKLNRWQI
jgi:hypothetical protein